MKNTWIVILLAISSLILVLSCGGGGGSSSVDIKSLRIAPSTALVFSGDTATFTVTGGDAPYTWTSGDQTLLVFLPDQSASDGSTAVFMAGGSGQTQVIVTDAGSRQATASVTVSSRSVRVVPREASVEFTGRNNPAQVSFRATGGFTPYSWSVDNGSVAVISGDTIDVDEVQVTANGIGVAQIIVFDDFNSSDAGILRVTGRMPRIVPEKAITSLSGTVTLIAADGVAPYLWEVEDSSLGSLSDITSDEEDEVIFTASANDEGSTFIQITDSAGFIARALIEIQRINPIIFPSQAFMLGGEEIVLRAEGGTLPFVWDSNPPEVGTLVVESATTARFTASAAIPNGVATITVEDGTGRTDTATITVTQFFSVLPDSVTLGVSDSFTFTVSGGTQPYLAVLSDSTVGTVSVSDNKVTITIDAGATSGDYILTVTDDNGITTTVDFTVS